MSTRTRNFSSSKKTTESQSGRFYPHLSHMPALPAIDYSDVGCQAPKILNTPNLPPKADVIIITWTEAEWAAMVHAFTKGAEEMPYSDAFTSYWTGWKKYDQDLPYYTGSGWTFWGYYLLVEIGGQQVLLFKSNTHLTWPGQKYVEELIYRLIDDVKPNVIFSIGTAGGARLEDYLGTVNVVNAGTYYERSEPQSEWPVYTNDYVPNWDLIAGNGFEGLLFQIPTTPARLQTLANQFNTYYGTNYSLNELNALGLDNPTSLPAINNMIPQGTSLLTTVGFIVGTTDGQYADFAVIEEDDAIIAKIAKSQGTAFCFVRNISDPVQNAALPVEAQGNWGGAVYDAFGFYTAYNGAIATWGILAV